MNMEVILDRTEETSISIDGDFEKNSYSKNLKLSFFQALAMNTKLSDEIKFMPGMSGKKYRYSQFGMRTSERFDVMNCSCFKWGENKSKLCSHLITSLDYVVRNSEFLDYTWNDGSNPIRHMLAVFLEDNISRKLDNILVELDDEEKELMGDFISKVTKS